MDIMLFEEFKDSNDYLMQKWFIAQKKQIESWFASNSMTGFTLDLFDWISNDSYSMYTANLKFTNNKNEYSVDFEIQSDKVVDGQVPEWIVKMRSYDVNTGDLLAETDKTVQLSEWNVDALVQLIGDIDDIAGGKESKKPNDVMADQTAVPESPETSTSEVTPTIETNPPATPTTTPPVEPTAQT